MGGRAHRLYAVAATLRVVCQEQRRTLVEALSSQRRGRSDHVGSDPDVAKRMAQQMQ